MLCQNCGKNEATTHIKQVINGDTAERHLCSDCAEHLGYGDAFSGFGFAVAAHTLLYGGALAVGSGAGAVILSLLKKTRTEE